MLIMEGTLQELLNYHSMKQTFIRLVMILIMYLIFVYLVGWSQYEAATLAFIVTYVFEGIVSEKIIR